jgi:flavin reductase (DIM6/NTAB) family NADH-FMN oxidoreductase RutF
MVDAGCVTIHSSHPFADAFREPARQFRGRLGGRVSLWTTGAGASRVGLSVTSLLAVGGEPWRLVAALDPDAEFTDALLASGRAVVSLLDAGHLQLAEAFGGGPAPGGPFRIGQWTQTAWGPRPADASAWAGVELETHHEVGWSVLSTVRIAQIEIIDGGEPPLTHYRGRYRLD